MTLLKGVQVPHLTLGDMDSLLDRYPYSHVVRLARVSFLKSLKDINLEDATTSAAVHVPAKGILYGLYNEKAASKSTEDYTDVEMGIIESEASSNAQEEIEIKLHKDSSIELEKQYLTEAVQSSISLEVDPCFIKEDVVEETKKAGEDPKSFLEFISGESAETNTVSENALIDDFLQSTRLDRSKTKTEFFNPEKMAKKSLQDKEGLVSDTLARIYANQGNYPKAIDAYERLILKYPEKSGYFAARIEKVKDLQRIKRK